MDSKELFLLLEKFLLDNDLYSQYVNYILERTNMTLEEWIKWCTSNRFWRSHPEQLLFLPCIPFNIMNKWEELIKNIKN